jgi:hypothetical protein
MKNKELLDLYKSYMSIYEAPFEITGPHSYKTGDSSHKDDTTIRNSPRVVSTYKGDDRATRKKARNKADKLNQEYGASVYRVSRVDEPRKRGTSVSETIEYLVGEGYADSYDSARNIVESWLDDLIEYLKDRG